MKIKSKIIHILAISVILLSTITPCCIADAVENVDSVTQPISTATNVETTKPYKTNELRHVFKKFLVSMGLVGASCLVLYILLNMYKKFHSTQDKTPQETIDVAKNLTTPDTIDEATKFFIEKF